MAASKDFQLFKGLVGVNTQGNEHEAIMKTQKYYGLVEQPSINIKRRTKFKKIYSYQVSD